jgi:hypothetical protein
MQWAAITITIISLLFSGAFFIGKRIGKNQCQQEVKDVAVKQRENVSRETIKAMSLSNRELSERLRPYTRGGKAPTVFTPRGQADP